MVAVYFIAFIFTFIVVAKYIEDDLASVGPNDMTDHILAAGASLIFALAWPIIWVLVALAYAISLFLYQES